MFVFGPLQHLFHSWVLPLLWLWWWRFWWGLPPLLGGAAYRGMFGEDECE